MANKRIDDASTGQVSSNVVGKIMGTKGDVIVVTPDGSRVKAGEGQKLRLNDKVLTEGGSVAVVQLEDLKTLSLGHDEVVMLDKDFLESLEDVDLESAIAEGINFDAIEQSLESGLTLDDILPAPAAGGDDVSAALGSAGSNASRIERTANEVTPESGFDTSAFLTNFQDIVFAENNFGQDFLSAVLNNSPTFQTISNSTIDQDQAWTLNLADYFSDPDPGQTLSYQVDNLPEGLVFDPVTGIISGSPTNAAVFLNGGEYIVNVNARDNSGGDNSSVTTSFTLSVNNVNDLPTIDSAIDAGSIDEDGRIIFTQEQLLAGASDLDQDALQVSSMQLVSGSGQILVNGAGNFEFTPSPDWNGVAEFSYVISDGQGGEISNTAILNIQAVNDAPVAVGDGVIGTEINTSLTLNVLANDYDVDGDDISIVSATANYGTVDVNADGTITYHPPSGYVGRDMVTYTISDGNGAQSTSLALVNIIVGNTPPVLGADASVDVNENTTNVGNFSATDAQNDSITYSLGGADATLFQIDQTGNLTFITAPDFEVNPGPFNVTVIATDNGIGNLSDTQALTINVIDVADSGINTAPVLGADVSISVDENTTAVGNFAASDADGDALTYSVDNALFSIDAAGNLSFVTAPDFESAAGPFSVTITATDSAGLVDTQNIAVNVTDTNEVPSIGATVNSTVTEDDTSYSVDLLVGASDPDTSDVLNIANLTLVSGNASGVTVNGNALDINPSAYNALAVGESAIITYSYDIEDGNGGSVAQTATITITGANDGPSVATAITSTTSEDDASYSVDLLIGASDVDASDTLNVANLTLVSGDASGVTVNGNSLDINPNSYNALAVGESAIITYGYDIIDGDGGSVAQTATITITGANEAPSISAAVTSAATEDDASYGVDLLAGASDPDSTDILNVTNLTLVSGDASGVTVNGNTLDINPSAYNALAVGESVVVTYSYDIEDGNGGSVAQTSTITITGANDTPSVASAITSTVSEDDASYSINLLADASDPDASDSLSVGNLTLTSGDASGVTVNENTLDINPSAYSALAIGESAVITYSYDIEDGNGGSVSQTATITITGANDGPSVATAITSTASEDDASYSVDLLAGASDADASDTLNVSNLTLVSGDASGVSINGNALDIIPSAYNALAVGESAIITYSYDIVDGNGGVVAQTATITITGTNDAPSVASAITSTASEDNASYSINLLAGASDPDASDSLNVSNLTLTSGDASGVTVNGNTLDINPSAYSALAIGESEVITYSYDIEDGNGGSVAQTATITITGANDAPSVSSVVTSTVSENDASYSVDLLAGASDPDSTDVLNVANLILVSGDASGVTVNGNILDINPNTYNALAIGESAVITYSYDIEDGNGGVVAQTATIIVTGANDGPSVVSAITSTATEDDASYSVDLLVGASDADASDILNIANLTLVSGDASGVTVNGNSLDINPNSYNALAVGESAIITYSYDIEDGNGGSVAQTATITITGANDGPVISSAVTSTATENSVAYSLSLLDGASDPDTSDTLNVSNITLVSGDASGVSINGNTLDIDPSVYNALADGESEVITYTYDIIDGNGGTVSQTATITITGGNGDPVVSSAVTSTASEEASPYSLNLLVGASDPDASDTLNVSNLTLVSGDASGVTVNGNSLDINPNAYNALAVGESAIIIYSYDIEDGNGGVVAQTATITIIGANDGPSVASTITSTASEDDASYSINLLASASDPDASDTLNVSNLTLVSGDASGVSINGNALDINPSAYNALAVGESAVITYSYDIEDGNSGSVAQTATITITGANDGPSVSSAVVSSATENSATYSLNLLDGASDPDSSDTLNVSNLTLVNGDAGGVSINGNTLDIDPSIYAALADGESEVITYTYDIIDGNGGTVSQTATITITGGNGDPVVSSAVTSTASEDVSPYNLNLLVGASDPDASDTLNVSNLTLVSGDASGVTVNGNSFDINPNAYNALAVGESAIIIYSYDIEDDNGGSVAQTATITITGANDGPSVTTAITSTAGEDDASYSVNLLAGASDVDTSDTLNVANLTLAGGDASGVTVNGNALDINPGAYNALAVGESVVVTYSYDIVDGNGGVVAQTATITITGANDGPLVASATTSTASENDAGYAIDLLAGASDPDASDSLSVTNLTLISGDDSGITVNSNTLDVNPSAYNALAIGESVVVTYSYDIVDSNGGAIAQTATITITGANDNPSVVSAITSTAAEDDASYSINLLASASDPDASDTLNVSNLTLVSGDASGVTVNGNALDINPNAYNALSVGESAVITYSYDIEDGNGGVIAQTATITITGANDGPLVASAITSTASENDASYSVDLLTGTSDPDTSDTLNVSNITLVSGDASGVSINGNSLDINPSAYNALAVGESVVVTYNYDIEDGNGGVFAQTATITITGANDGPTVSSAVVSAATENSATYSLNLLDGASDPDSSDTLNVSNLTLVNGDAGGVSINGNTLDIDPSIYAALADGESEVITYTYDIIDGNGGTVSQTATITITGGNGDPVVSSAVTSTVSEDDGSYSIDLLAGASDPDASDSLNVGNLTLTSGDASGVSVNGNSLDVNPSAYNALAVGESATITYSYDIVDGNGGSVSQTATITITGANDGPVVSSAVTSTATENSTAYSLNLLDGASDPDTSDTLNVNNITLVSGDASGVSINGNTLDIDPSIYAALADGESEIITYTYDIIDGNGGAVSQTATITITGGNGDPVVSGSVVSSVSEDVSPYSLNLLIGASDPDASDILNVANLTLVSGDASGVTVNGNSLDINPNAYNALAVGESAIITYSYDIEDGNGGSVAQTATITIAGANDGPSVSSVVTSTASENDASYSVDLLAGASDADVSDSLSISNLTLTSGDASGVTINVNSLDINPSAYNELAIGESVVIIYSYDIVDGNGGSVSQTATITITGANDGPSVAAAITSAASENDASYSVDLLADASDPDSSDTLNVNNLTLISGNASGVTVNGNTLDINPSAYNALAVGESAVITYSYDIEDSNGGSVAQTAIITITGANDGPSVVSAITSTVTEDDASYSVDLLGGASDPDSTNVLNIANLTLASGDASGITVNGNSLDINPSAYNALAIGESVVVTYSYDIEDANGGSVAQTATITITGANDGPSVATAITSTTSEDDASYSVNLLASASDVDSSDTLNVANLTLVSGDASGVAINGNALDINPSAYNALAVGESIVVTYSYDIEDGNGGSVAQTATITITGANDSPSVSSVVTSTVSENDASYSVDLLAGVSDPDSTDVLNVANLILVSGDASGVTVNGNVLDINPNTYNALAVGESAVITYSYDIEDGNGGVVAQTATITITGANDGPSVTGAVTSTATEDDISYSVDLLAGASDPDVSDSLSVSNLTLTNGDASGVTVNGNTLDISPSAYNDLAIGESVVITYSYDIEDGNSGSVAQTATITITGANDAPSVASAITSAVTEDDASYSVDLLAGTSDPDSTDVLNVANLTLASGDASGVTVNGNSLDINPNAYNALAVGESAIITYSYDIEDGNGGSVAQTATITITGANDGPSVVSVITSTATEDDASYSVDLLVGASDVDASDTLNVANLTLVSGDASGVTINGNTLDINPSAYNAIAVGESAIITYSYDIEDGNGGSVAQTATITITGANDGPSVATAITSTASEDDASYSVNLLAGASDADASDVLNVANLTLVSGDASGVTVNGNSLDINPNTYNALAIGEFAVITYSYDIEDGNGGVVAQTATITITGANDAPLVASAITSTASEDDASYSINLLAAASDPDASDSLSVGNLTLTSGDASGVSVNGNSLDINPNAYNALAVGESVVVTYSYNIEDGNGGSVVQAATITITGANDGPTVATAITSTAGEDDASYSVNLLAGASDVDSSDTLNIANLTLVSGDASGVTINGNALDINPSAYNALAVGESAIITYSYDIEDGNGGSVAQTATITITGANDGPAVSSAVVSSATENSAIYSLNLLDGASDPDASDTLNVSNITLVSGDASGVTVNGNVLDINPNTYNALAIGESAVITYSYDIEDGNGGVVAQTATITITGANDVPSVASAITSTASEDNASYSINLLTGAIDPDASDVLNVANLTLASGDASGVTVNGNSLDINPNTYNALAVGESATITYSYDIIDGNGGSVSQTATITITGANDGPSVATAITSTASEDDAPYSVDLLVGASDVDASDTLNVANLTLVSGDAFGVSINGNALDINPSAYNALAVGESAIITYSYDIVDGNGGVVAQTATITIIGSNDGPSVTGAVTSTASENDASYSVDLLAGTSDPDANDSLNVSNLTLTSGDASGVTVNGNVLDINPNAYNALSVGESVVVTYSYNIEDGNGGSVVQTATITITGANDGPTVATAITSTASEDDASYSVNLLVGASDPDTSDTLNVSNLTLVSGNASGVTVNGSSLDINPSSYNALAIGESVVITYSYDIVDGNGGSVSQTATITITGANDGPAIVSAITSTATEDDASYSVNLLVGASDADASDILNIANLTLVSGDASGVTVNGNSLDINPNTYNALAIGESATITYSYDIVDGNGGSVSQTATITITGANDGPSVATVITSTASEDDVSYSVNLLVGASDADASDILNIANLTLVSGDASGVTVNGNALDINPSAYNALAVGESAVITYSYDIEDGNGGVVAQTATITITITGANDGPLVASAITSTASEDDASYSINLLAGASDPDTSDSLNVSNLTLTSGEASGVTVNGNTLDINPSAYNALAIGESAVITYSYDIEDGNGGSIAQTATITITGANDGPAVSSAVVSSATENSATYSLNLLDGASDPDVSDTLNVSNLTLVSGDASGVTINGNTLDINPSAYNALAVGESAIITYSYDIEDGNGGSVAQTATITITGANDGPSVASAVTSTASENDASYSVDLLAGASDPDTSDTLNIANLTLVGGDASGVTVNGNALDINPNAYNALAVGESAIITYSYDIVDGNGGIVAQTATITITGANDGPSVVSAITSTVTEDDAGYSVDLLAGASDPDANDSLDVSNLTLTGGDASGVTINGNTLDINPSAYNALAVGESAIITYSYDIEDGNGGSVAQTATITITGANDGPSVATTITSTASEDDASYSVNLLAGASDADASDILNIANLTLVNGDASGVTVNGNSLDINPGTYNTLAVGESAVITYSYDIEDGNGGSVAQTATITITGANDAPIISSAINLGTINEDGSILITQALLLANASDVDASDTLVANNLSVASGLGTLTDNGNGTWTFNPTANWSGNATIDFDVSDGSTSVATSASLSVNAVADAPELSVNSDVINVSSVNEIPPPASTGLLFSFYDELNNTDRTAALQEGIIDPANATSQIRQINGFGNATIVTNTGVVQTNGSTIEIDTGDSYSVTGLIYLEEGNTYQFAGYHDDSLRIELGGQTMVSTTGDSYGNYGPGQAITGNVFTATASGYYTIEAFVNNVSGIGQFSLNLSVNGGAAQIINGSNFNIYTSLTDLAVAGGQFGTFVASTDNTDGGYFPQVINTGLIGTYIEISNIIVNLMDVDGSESVQNIILSDIPVDATLTDGTNIFTASAGNTSIDLLAQGWNLSNIQILPPDGFVGDLDLTVSASSIESSNSDTATTTQTITVSVVDPGTAAGGLDPDLLGDSVALEGSSGNDILTDVDSEIQFNANSNNVFTSNNAFNFSFSSVTTAISSISLSLLQGNWDPGAGATQHGVVVGSQSSGLSINASNFSFSGGNSVLTIDLSTENIITGSTFAFGVDFDNVSGGSNAAGVMANLAVLTVTLEDGRTQSVLVDNAGDTNNNTAQANLQFNSDIIMGNDGNDTITTGAGDQLVLGGSGNDTITLGAGNDAAQGQQGNDTINGGNGNDSLSGGDGIDTILGGAGNDIIFGDAGSDTLTGGSGRDTFVWRSQDDDGSTDTITDFTFGAAGDILHMADVLDGESANAVSLDSYFNFSANAGNTTITVDSDGVGGNTDLTIVIQGVDLVATYGSDQAILQNLLDDGNLLTG